LSAEKCRQPYSREEVRDRDADLGIGGNHVLLGFQYLRAALQQRRRRAKRCRRRGLLRQGMATRDILRIRTEKRADRVFLLRDLTFQVLNVGVAGIVRRLGTLDGELVVLAGLESKTEKVERVFVGVAAFLGDRRF